MRTEMPNNLRRAVPLALATLLSSTGALAAQDRDASDLSTRQGMPSIPGTVVLPDIDPSARLGIPRLPTVITRTDEELPESLLELPLVQQGLVDLGREGELGALLEVRREPRRAIETDKLDLLPDAEDDHERENPRTEYVPPIDDLKGRVSFEFFDLPSQRTFAYTVDRAVLAKYSRAVSLAEEENERERRPADEIERRLEDAVGKSWSNATDNRIRRAVADGFADTHSIYQSLADYGGCSATVLSANWQRMVAITAAHCVFTSGNNFSSSKLRPRRDGVTSPTWGSWSATGFGYYPQYLNNDCEDNWNGNACIRHDIALVIARPDPGAVPPQGMGWGYRPKSFLDSHSKYRRGYPGCGNGHSPANCTSNTLYGDGLLSVGNFSKLDGDNWNRQIRFSSDVNPGDSGSGLYYYRNGNPYVFAVTSAEPSGCKTSCTSSRPNYGRRITPQFFDFINTVIN